VYCRTGSLDVICERKRVEITVPRRKELCFLLKLLNLEALKNSMTKKSSTISIEIPREVIHITRMTPQELRRELAIYLFQQGKLSFGKAREMINMNVWEFQQILGSRGIPVHYDVEDYEEDLATLKELGRL